MAHYFGSGVVGGVEVKFSRFLAMPNSETFSIKPISELLGRYIRPDDVVVDPFARNSKRGTITNDLNPQTSAEFHMDANDFCFMLRYNGCKADVGLFDPPYSPRQVKERYELFGIKVEQSDTQSGRYNTAKDELAMMIKPNGLFITCGWSTYGAGVECRFQIEEIMIVSHGGGHNDTIITVERKHE